MSPFSTCTASVWSQPWQFIGFLFKRHGHGVGQQHPMMREPTRWKATGFGFAPSSIDAFGRAVEQAKKKGTRARARSGFGMVVLRVEVRPERRGGARRARRTSMRGAVDRADEAA